MSTDPRVGILLFHPANVFGGAERTVVNLLKHLPGDRTRVVLVGMPDVFAEPGADAFYSLDEIGIHPGFASLRRSFNEARILVSIARREDCRVFLGMLHYGAIQAALCRIVSGFRLRTIASPRTPSVAGIRLHVGERGKDARLWWRMVTGFCRISNRIIVASEGLKSECVDVFGANARRVCVIPNCVEDSLIQMARKAELKTQKHASPERPWHIITAGRLAPEKDVGTLIRAFAILRKHTHASLEILGSGPELDELRRLAQDLGVGDDIFFAGFTAHPMERIKSADLCVHTALFEGFGNSLLEAMACGVPLVATDCDFGPREIIKNGHNGMLVRPSDPEHLAEVLSALLDNPELRQRIASNGVRDVEQYGAGLMADRYEAVFIELAKH